MQDVYLFGTNTAARVLAAWIKSDSRYNLQGFTVNRDYLSDCELDGYPIVGLKSIDFSSRNIGVINCVGYSDQLENRKNTHTMLSDFPLLTYVHPGAIVASTYVGKGCVIMANAVIETGSKIGEGNLLYGGVYICHDANIGNYNWFSAGSVLAGHCIVGDRNFIGINACIRERIVIASGSTIGAGAVIVKDVPDNCTVVGNPGRVLSK